MLHVHSRRIRRCLPAGWRLAGLLVLLLTGLAVFTPAPARAQSEACAPAIDGALTQLESACSGLGRNTACYGNTRVNAAFTREELAATFTNPSDRVALADLLALRTQPLDPTTGEWGIAALSVQANLPDALPGQNVVFMLIGDAGIAPDRTAPPDAPPMQMIRLRTDFGAVTCEDAPRSLVLAQGPRNVTVEMTINGLDVSFGSTIALYQNSRDSFWIATIDGTVLLEGTIPVPPGEGALIDLYPLGGDQRVLEVRPLTDEERAVLDPLTELPSSLFNYPVAWGDQAAVTPTVPPPPAATTAPVVTTPTPAATTASATTTPAALAEPIVTLTADTTTLTAGSCTFIRWNTANIDSVFYNSSPTVGTSERQECPTTTTTYTLTVQFRDGTRRDYPITLTVSGDPTTEPTSAPTAAPTTAPTVIPTNPPAPTSIPTSPSPPPVIVFFTVDDDDPPAATCTFLRWEVTGAFSIRLAGVFVTPSGTQEICPTAETTYLLEALGSTTVTATVTVDPD